MNPRNLQRRVDALSSRTDTQDRRAHALLLRGTVYLGDKPEDDDLVLRIVQHAIYGGCRAGASLREFRDALEIALAVSLNSSAPPEIDDELLPLLDELHEHIAPSPFD